MIRIGVLLLLTTLALSAREPKQIKLANQGTIAGMYITRFRTKRIAAYLGIPYAQPPIGNRRFSNPEYIYLPQWDGVRNATLYAPDCLQIDPNETMSDSFKDMGQITPPLHDELFMKLLDTQLEEKPRRREYSEDCLYLNVYVPDAIDINWSHNKGLVLYASRGSFRELLGCEMNSLPWFSPQTICMRFFKKGVKRFLQGRECTNYKVEKYPTMVWLHGGSFVRGSPNNLNPFHLVLKHKIIFVSVAYRLSIFGFFSSLDNEAPGNFGLYDQVAALNWVKNNIESFGGDPDNVCIFGHEAGAVSVGIHLISSYSAGLFQKAIAMSGNVLSPDTINTAAREVTTVDKVSQAFACFRKPSFQMLDCLRNVNDDSILKIAGPMGNWGPILDSGFSNVSTPFIPDLPSRMFKDGFFLPVPMLTGYTNMEDALRYVQDSEGISQKEFDRLRDENIISDITKDGNNSCYTNQQHILDAVSLFYRPFPPTTNETVLLKLILDFYTDKVHGSTTYELAKHLSKHSPVYLYRFDLKPFSDIVTEGIPEWIGVPHNFDLTFAFGLPHLALPEDFSKWDIRDKSISDVIMKMWSNFAWYSNPTNSGINILWEPFEVEKPGFLIIDRKNFTMSTAETINYRGFEFWSDFYPKVVEIGTKCCGEIFDDSGAESILTSRIISSLLTIHLILTLLS